MSRRQARDARGLLRGVVERPAHLARVETGGAGRGGRGAEGPGDAVRGQAALVAELGAAHGHDHARADVVAERHGAKEARAVDAEFLAGRERRGHDRAARMRARGVVRVVGLIRMRHDAVGERGVDRRGGERRARDRRRALSAVRADVAQRRLAGRQFRSGDHRRQGIEQMVLGVLRYFGRERACSGGAHIGAECAHLWSGTGRLREIATSIYSSPLH